MIWFNPKATQNTTTWAGGKTTQLMIWPLDANYGDRNFDFRFSTASIDSEESHFSDLTGYMRYLMTLDSPITLWEDDRLPVNLLPLSLYTFNGAAKVRSHGRARDYNLMIKPPCTATLDVLDLSAGESLPRCQKDVGLYCLKGAFSIISENGNHPLTPEDFLFVSADEQVEITATEDSTIIYSTLFLEELL